MRCALRKDSLFIAYQLPWAERKRTNSWGWVDGKLLGLGQELGLPIATKTGYQVSFLVGSKA